MKRISLILLLISAVFISSAQHDVPNYRKSSKKHGKVEQTNDSATPSVDNKNNVTAVTPSDNSSVGTSDFEHVLLRQAIDNAFLIVRSSYNVRDQESGSNVSGTDFFGTVYSVVPLLSYGFGVDNRFLKPWKSDPNYDASKYGEDMVSVDKLEYKKVKDAIYMPYALNKTTGESLAPGFFHVADSTFQNLGLRVELGNGTKTGYMVWFHVNPENGETRYIVVPTKITFNENTIFSVRQPANPETVIGGLFLNLNADEPGCLRLNLMGVARMDPYGGNKWELVKMQAQPTVPEKNVAEPASNTKKQEAAPKEQQTKDDSIIPAQDDNKGKKKEKTKKEKSK